MQQSKLFKQSFLNPETRIDTRLLKQKAEHEEDNKEILRTIVLAVEFSAKQGLLEDIVMTKLIF